MEIELEKYRILETGVDGGHKYISSSLKHNGSQREITVIFKHKNEEQKLTKGTKLKIKGILQYEGPQFPLTLLESEIIENV